MNSIIFLVVVLNSAFSVVYGHPAKREDVEVETVVEGDMVYSVIRNKSDTRAGALNYKGYSNYMLWPDNTVIYYLDPSVNTDNTLRTNVLTAMSDLERATRSCIRFRPYSMSTDQDKHYTTIRANTRGSCTSTVGYDVYTNDQNVDVDKNVCPTGSIAHELLHTLGFLHEQTRDDRENYVHVNYSNAKDEYKVNYQLDGVYFDTSYHNVAYNYESIMHYRLNVDYFAIDPTIPIMTHKCNSKGLGYLIDIYNDQNYEYLSWGDVQMLINRYNCKNVRAARYNITGIRQRQRYRNDCPIGGRNSKDRKADKVDLIPHGNPNCLLPDSAIDDPKCKVTTPKPESRGTPTTSKMTTTTTSTSRPNMDHSDAESDMLSRAKYIHNKFRSHHQAPPLTLSDQLNENAAKCAKYYASKGRIDHTCQDGAEYGQNLNSFVGYLYATDITEMSIDGWHEEEDNYDYKKAEPNTKSSNFTQLVWRSSKQLGFAVASVKDFNVAVALYSPPGNVPNLYRNNVFPDSRTYKDVALERHNDYRHKHQVAGLRIESDMNRRAVLCAKYYASINTVDYSCPHTGGHSESLLEIEGALTYADVAEIATDYWYSEEKKYDYDDPENISKSPEDFTQLVWKSTTMFGFGAANTSGRFFYAVALYSPPGNIKGQYKDNVFPPLYY